MKAPSRPCLKCGRPGHWGDCDPPSPRKTVAEAAKLVSEMPEPKPLPRPARTVAATQDRTPPPIDAGPSGAVSAKFDKKAWQRAYMVGYRKRTKKKVKP